MTRPRSLPSAVFKQPHTLRSASQPCARGIPSTAGNHSRHLLLKTANAVYVAKGANSGFEASGMHDMVAASARWHCLRAPHLRPPQQQTRTPIFRVNVMQRCSAACFPARFSCARGRQDRGEMVCESFTMCCTAGLGAKVARREGSGGGGRKVTRRVRVFNRLMAAHSCAPGEELFSLQDSNAGGRPAVQPAI